MQENLMEPQELDPAHAAAQPLFAAYMQDLNRNARIYQTDWIHAEKGAVKYTSNFTNLLWLAFLAGHVAGSVEGGVV